MADITLLAKVINYSGNYKWSLAETCLVLFFNGNVGEILLLLFRSSVLLGIK